MSTNFSTLFKTAHQIAKQNRASFASYREAFRAALITAWQLERMGQIQTVTLTRKQRGMIAEAESRLSAKTPRSVEQARRAVTGLQNWADKVRDFAPRVAARCEEKLDQIWSVWGDQIAQMNRELAAWHERVRSMPDHADHYRYNKPCNWI